MTSASAPLRPRRGRHGRGLRGPMAWPPVPAMATRAEQFDELVLDAAARIEQRLGRPLGDAEFAVEDVPPSDPAPWESSDVPLGRLFAAQGKMPARQTAGPGAHPRTPTVRDRWAAHPQPRTRRHPTACRGAARYGRQRRAQARRTARLVWPSRARVARPSGPAD